VIEPGQDATDFELSDQDGRAVKLSDFRGQRVVLYFYPKTDSPGCTKRRVGHKSNPANADRANSEGPSRDGLGSAGIQHYAPPSPRPTIHGGRGPWPWSERH